MKYTKKSFAYITLLVVSLAGVFSLSIPDVVDAARCGEAKTSVIDCGVNEENPTFELIGQIVNFLAIGVGIAVVGGIVYGAIIYTTSNGEPAKTKQAVTIIVNAVIGLVLFIFAYAIMNFLIPGGAF